MRSRPGWTRWGLLTLAVLLGGAGPVSADAAPPLGLTVVSYNVAGVPIVHPEVSARLAEIGRWLSKLRPDIVCLQEVWRSRDVRDLQAAGRRAGLPFSARFTGRRGGPGLLTLSRFEIRQERFRAFPRNGSLAGLLRGHVDILSRKGLGTVVVTTPRGPLAVVNTHLIAHDRVGGRDRAYGTRYEQILEVTRALEGLDAGAPALLLGDLNATPTEGMVRLLLRRVGLVDAVASRLSVKPRRRIDHVLARAAAGGRIEVQSAELALTRPRPLASGVRRRLSDHPAVVVRLLIHASPQPGR